MSENNNYIGNLIYLSSAEDEEFINCFILDNIIDTYNNDFYIKLCAGGDYNIKIFEYYDDIELTNTNSVGDFINLFGKTIIYDKKKIIYDGYKYQYKINNIILCYIFISTVF